MTVKKKTANKGEAVGVRVAALNLKRLTIKLVGDSILVQHAWPDKIKMEMLEKQMQSAESVMGREPKNPDRDFVESMYWMSTKVKVKSTKAALKKACFGVPARAFKCAAVSACAQVKGMTKVQCRGAFHVLGDLVPIKSDPPVMREDMVRIGMGKPDVRHRGEFRNWSCELEILYNASSLSAAQIVNLFNVAGFAVGVCEFRPEKNGSWGMFHVAGGAS